ncbi:MAG: GNAT family N-acetyltransferase, partial [Chitinivibrionales bacterium]
RMQRLPSEQMKNFIYINPRTDVAIVATLPEAYGDEIVGVGRYYLDETDNMAEVAFTVRDSWQNHGIGTMLFEKLSAIAKSNAISGFKAEVLSDNYMMQSVLNKSADEVTSKRDDNSITYRIKF